MLLLTLDLLYKVIDVLPVTCSTGYETYLFTTTLLLAFFGFLRVSEYCTDLRVKHKCIQRGGVHISDSNILYITVPFSKTDQQGRSQTLMIPSAPKEGLRCPLSTVIRYLLIRPKGPGPLFRPVDGSDLTRFQFTSVFHQAIHLAQIGKGSFNTHSLHIGAATYIYLKGYTDDEIKKMGRWADNSTVFQWYIRVGRQ